ISSSLWASSSRRLGSSSLSSTFSDPRAKDGRPGTIPGMPGRWNGPQVRRRRSSISLKFQRSKVAGLSGTSSTRLILIGNSNDKHEQAMNAATTTADFQPESTWIPSKGVVGMSCLIIAESAIFSIFVVAYLYYLGKDLSGPTPRQVLELPILNSICLLSSSA